MSNPEENFILILKQSLADQLEAADQLFDIALRLSEVSTSEKGLTSEELNAEAEKVYQTAKNISNTVRITSSTLSKVVLSK